MIYWETHRIACVVACCTLLLKEVVGSLRIGEMFKNVERICVTDQCEFRISEKSSLENLIVVITSGAC